MSPLSHQAVTALAACLVIITTTGTYAQAFLISPEPSFESTMDASPSAFPSPSSSFSMPSTPSATVTPTLSVSGTPLVSPLPMATIAPMVLVSHSSTGFNSPAPLLITAPNMAFAWIHVADVYIQINNVVVPTSDIKVTQESIRADVSFNLNAENTILVSIYYPKPWLSFLTLYEKVWIGARSLTVNLIDSSNNPYLTETTVKAILSDNLTVSESYNTTTASWTFQNIPDRTIIIEATSATNDFGTGAVVGSAGSVTVTLDDTEDDTTSEVDNNDFSQGLDGWTKSEDAIVSIVTHVEDVGPPIVSPEPDFESPSPEGLENKDLRLTTAVEGEVFVKRTFRSKPATTGVRVRYRFVTTEVPGGFFGSKYNDYFSVSIRSKNAGGHITESASMNGLGLAAFHFGSGSTSWRETSLPLTSSGDVIIVSVIVANVGDGAYDSTIEIDFVEELS